MHVARPARARLRCTALCTALAAHARARAHMYIRNRQCAMRVYNYDVMDDWPQARRRSVNVGLAQARPNYRNIGVQLELDVDVHVCLCVSLCSHSIIDIIHAVLIVTFYCSYSTAKYSAVDCVQWVRLSHVLHSGY